jgi:hypothetical protein
VKVTGFGEPLARWQVAFPEDQLDCQASNCYGPVVRDSSSHYEFSYVTTERGRVDGFDLALSRGTSLVRAQLQIAELFPSDVQMGSLSVIHRDSLGNSCAVYNLQSKTVEKIFGAHAFGDSDGTVGVELARLLKSGRTTYQPGDVTLALVVPTYLGTDANC